jgi:hypothetical protein
MPEQLEKLQPSEYLERLGNQVRAAYAHYVDIKESLPVERKSELTEFYLLLDRLKAQPTISENEVQDCEQKAKKLISDLKIEDTDYAFKA